MVRARLGRQTVPQGPNLAHGQAAVVAGHGFTPKGAQAPLPQGRDRGLQQQAVLEAAAAKGHLAAAAELRRPGGQLGRGPGQAQVEAGSAALDRRGMGPKGVAPYVAP